MNVRQRLHQQVARSKRKFFELFGERAVFSVDYDGIIKEIGLPQGDLECFEIDHIVPLSYHLNGNMERLKDAWHPKNLRWLDISSNRIKSASVNSVDEIRVFQEMKDEN